MVIIRHERPADIAPVRHVLVQAFGRSEEAAIVDALRARNQVTLALVAVKDAQVVGYILFSPVTMTAPDRVYPAIGLAPMAVLPAVQRQGIGSALVTRGLTLCQEAGHACVVVLGHPTYYPRFGFVPASRYRIRCDYEVPDEAFMVRELYAGALQNCTGVAQYQPEFYH